MNLAARPPLGVRAAAEELLPPPGDGGRGEPLPEDDVAAPPPRRPAAAPWAAGAAALDIEALYRRHHRFVFRLALRYGRGNVAWAEDVTQDVFLDLMKALATLTERDGLEGWLYRATSNRCLNRLRRDRFLGLPVIRWVLGQAGAEPRPLDEVTIARDDLRRALEAVGKLPPKEQVAFSMFYLDGKDQEEIGKTLGHSKGYVCKLIQQAVARLRDAGWEVGRDARS
ncbi:sigma-70 family RNA polymerase sigma factor [Sorangium sp. So ce260]|uniref:RNA polymerase sigma factor n=1 Tax=Sorangium sp. So ce260 TaxID=3133291 RepID=UPI003F5E860C